ncbi:hypothetical protein CB1_000595071 [Camelus ferus]|nr:hypothetical protein CB1_000595071 [Camelus ferus]
MEHRAVPLLGHLPQDLVDTPVLLQLHPSDRPLMLAVHKKRTSEELAGLSALPPTGKAGGEGSRRIPEGHGGAPGARAHRPPRQPASWRGCLPLRAAPQTIPVTPARGVDESTSRGIPSRSSTAK